MSVEITNEDSFQCAGRLVELKYKPVVLNFASGTNAGGGWRGKQQGTQEETLCRQSDLGLLLEKKKYPIPNDGAHYIPNVNVTKDRSLKNIQPFKCAVIASELKSIAMCKSEYLQMRFELLYKLTV